MQPLHHDDPKQIGNYKLIARLGHGGMGVVYYARRHDGTLVAIKIITPLHANKEEYRKRFEHEINLARKINSPYVAKIIDYDTSGEVWWFASEYVTGLTIAQAVERYGRALPAETVRKLIYDLALALQAVHEQNIVHRDIKPQNVILSPTGIKIIDFGIAHSVDGTQMTTDGIIGTPAYMCPEQLEGKRPQSPWDIFALGGLIVYACSGHAPFVFPDNRGAHQMLFDIMDENVAANLDGVDSEFHDIINRCLAKKPGLRPNAGQIHQFMKVMPESQMPETLFLTDVLKTAIRVQQKESERTALHVQAMKPIPRPRKSDESVASWERRNRTYLREMEVWRKAERKRRREVRKAKRVTPLTVKWLVFLVICALAYQQWPRLSDWWGEIRKHIPTSTAEAAPRELPQDKTTINLPGASFTVGKPGQTYDPDNKDSYFKVTGIVPKGYQIDVSATAIGYDDYGDAAFSDSCVKVHTGKSTVTVYPTTYQTSGKHNGQITGTMVFSTVFRGGYTFYASCNLDQSVRGVFIGSAGNVNKGIMQYKGTVIPVMGVKTSGSDLTVNVIPDDHGSSQYCFRNSGTTKRPAAIRRSHIGDIVFTELTFKGVGSKGILYPTCSEKNHSVTVHGGGVKIK